MEVGDSFLLEFEGTRKRGIRKLGGIGEIEPKHQPYYLANILRQRRVVGDSDITFLKTRTKEPKAAKKDKKE